MKFYIVFIAAFHIFHVVESQKNQTGIEISQIILQKSSTNSLFPIQILKSKLEEESQNNLYYHLIYKQGRNHQSLLDDEPLIVWLNGGPGCASTTQVFSEVGPFDVTFEQEQYLLKLRDGSWNQLATLLLIDQPVGVGLSWTNSQNIINSTQQAAENLAEFLFHFFTSHPKLLKNPFYIFGVSFGGHYVPALGVQIFEHPLLKEMNINYKGIGIGDGLTNNFYQSTYFSSFYYSIGIIDNRVREITQQIQTQSQQAILNGDYSVASANLMKLVMEIPRNYTGDLNPYNFQTYRRDHPKINYLNNFVNDHKVALFREKFQKSQEQLGFPLWITYTECNSSFSSVFQIDISQSRQSDVEYLLKKGKILLYNGQNDIVINNQGFKIKIQNLKGALLWVNQINWDQMKQWKAQPKQQIRIKNIPVGSVKMFNNFTYVVLYKAGNKIRSIKLGHAAPQDQPEAGLAMLQHFINNDQDWSKF